MNKEYHPKSIEKLEVVEAKTNDYVAVYVDAAWEKSTVVLFDSLRVIGAEIVEYQPNRFMISIAAKCVEQIPEKMIVYRPSDAPVYFGVNE